MYEVRVKCQSGETNPTNSQMEFHLDSGHRRLVYDAVPRSQSCQMASDHRTNHTKTKRKGAVDVVIRRTGTERGREGNEVRTGNWGLGIEKPDMSWPVAHTKACSNKFDYSCVSV